MRPRLFTVRNILLAVIAAVVFGVLVVWLNGGAQLPFAGVPSTAGKVLFTSDRGGGGHTHLYMADGLTGANSVQITGGSADDRSPAWSPDGGQLAFVSENRTGVTPQVFVAEARVSADAAPLTNTSPTKNRPWFGPQRRIYYLSSGKLLATTPTTEDTDQVFPTADETKTVASLFANGGVVSADVSPDGSEVAVALQLEHGQALLLCLPDPNTPDLRQCLLIGVAADGVFFHFLPNGELVALLSGGAPLPKPALLFGPDQVKAALPAVGPLDVTDVTDQQVTLSIGSSDEPGAQQRLPLPRGRWAVQYGADGKIGAMLPLGLAPTGFAVAADSSFAIVTTETATATPTGVLPAGVYTLPLPLSATAHGQVIAQQPASAPTLAPDGRYVAFVSGSDVFVSPVAPSATSTNVTNGQGKNSEPTWSPAAAGK